jgi:hypothetical protein
MTMQEWNDKAAEQRAKYTSEELLAIDEMARKEYAARVAENERIEERERLMTIPCMYCGTENENHLDIPHWKDKLKGRLL